MFVHGNFLDRLHLGLYIFDRLESLRTLQFFLGHIPSYVATFWYHLHLGQTL